MRVLVLGGTGSIGGAVVDALLAREHEVIALVRSASAAARTKAVGAQALPGDIRAPVARAPEDPPRKQGYRRRTRKCSALRIARSDRSVCSAQRQGHIHP